jgi:hypothetical protein
MNRVVLKGDKAELQGEGQGTARESILGRCRVHFLYGGPGGKSGAQADKYIPICYSIPIVR